ICADKAAHHRHLSVLDQRLNSILQAKICVLVLRNCLHVCVVGDEDVARIDMDTFQAAGFECGGNDLAGKHFSERGDVVSGAGCDLADSRDSAKKFVESFEIATEI